MAQAHQDPFVGRGLGMALVLWGVIELLGILIIRAYPIHPAGAWALGMTVWPLVIYPLVRWYA